jgi:hypothetical protein
MADVQPDQRQRAKTAAANASVAANDTAVVLGATGAVVAFGGVASGVGALAGVGVGAILGVCSFGAWWVGNRYQRLANDPPRADFDQFLTSSAIVNDAAVPPDEPMATAFRFAAQNVVLADAVAALVISLERYDGALAAGNANAASAQANSVLANAQKAISAADTLSGFANDLNAAWTSTIPTVAWNNVAITQAQDLLSSSVGSPAQPGQTLSQVLASIQNLVDTPDDVTGHPLFSIAAMPSQPSVLVSGAFLTTMGQLSDALKTLVSPDIG